MIYLAIFLILVLCFAILGLIINHNKNKEMFQRKIDFLESIIEELNINLENQNQKVKLSEGLKLKLKLANESLSNDIMNLNLDLFEKTYPKKTS